MNYSHGLSHTRIDTIYKSMKARCYNRRSVNYKRYGGRGIHICEEWLKDKRTFFKWAFENGYNASLTLDRVDNNGDYSPENCKWSTYKEQNNNRRSNVFLDVCGQRKTIAQWADIYGVKKATIWARLKRGWNVEDAVKKPVVHVKEHNAGI